MGPIKSEDNMNVSMGKLLIKSTKHPSKYFCLFRSKNLIYLAYRNTLMEAMRLIYMESLYYIIKDGKIKTSNESKQIKLKQKAYYDN
ncbi:hypothetical protein [Flammeovirga agarivorans]|uniref:Uncharacterized protein n=1 Tax=Flammeovirga agarivorans TaxID=2726742 RepID=A0A7X8XZA1_9BACT|nr:hypothetical protein [Flammeovirga agarivorans]NLR94967.1 hypothetical protein [Flammeovirga agarivorans]